MIRRTLLTTLGTLCLSVGTGLADTVLPGVRPADEPLAPALTMPVNPGDNGTVIQTQTIAGTGNISSNADIAFVLKKVRFSGNRALSDDSLQTLAKPYIGQAISAADLRSLQTRISQYYISRGFINSGARLPDQAIKNGIVQFEVTEGLLSEINYPQETKLRKSYLDKRITFDNTSILNINTLENNLKILRNNDNIENLHARLIPATEPGQSILQLELIERAANRIELALDNHSSASIGEPRGRFHYRNTNLFGGSEQLNIGLGYSEGLEQTSIDFTLPITAAETSLLVRHHSADAEIVEEPFTALDIISDTNTTTVGVKIPLNRNPGSPRLLSFELDKRQSETELTGLPFSFSAGFVNGQAKVTALRVIHQWNHHGNGMTVGLRNKLSVGLDALDSTINSSPPDSEFTSLINQFIFVKHLPERRMRWLLKTDLQLSSDPLLSMEQFAIGGANTVRGYRENLLIGDTGIVASFEWHYRPLRTRRQFWLSGFIDYGRVDNQGRAFSGPDTLYSAGIGLRWQFAKQSKLQIDWGAPLKDIDQPDNSVQDDGFHLSLVSQWLF